MLFLGRLPVVECTLHLLHFQTHRNYFLTVMIYCTVIFLITSYYLVCLFCIFYKFLFVCYLFLQHFLPFFFVSNFTSLISFISGKMLKCCHLLNQVSLVIFDASRLVVYKEL